MATTPATIPAGGYGVDNLLAGFIVWNEEITETDIYHTIADQKGAVVAEYPYDTRFDLTLTLHGNGVLPLVGSQSFAYASKVWKCDKVSKPAAYNDTVKYTVTAYRHTNFPGTAPAS